MNELIRKPSAWIPILIPLIFLAYVAIVLVFVGPPVREKDEGVGAHLFQLWLASEPFMLGFFAVKWLPQAPKRALVILVMQIIAALAGCFPVFYFHL